MLGNINHQILYMKVLQMVFIIYVYIIDEFLRGRAQSFVGNDDSAVNLFVSNHLVELRNILSRNLGQDLDKIHKDFFLFIFVLENLKHSRLLREGLELLLELFLSDSLQVLRNEIISVVHHFQDCFEGLKGLLELVGLHYKNIK
jgi:hypothetical protein